MIYRRGRYSGYIRPFNYLVDLCIVNFLASQFILMPLEYLNYIIFVTIGWLILSLKLRFYDVYRFTRATKIAALVLQQAFFFTLIVFSFFGFYNELNRSATEIVIYIAEVIGLITLIKFTIFYFLKKYRVILGGNYRQTVIVGVNEKTLKLKEFFTSNPEYGYHLKHMFEVNDTNELALQDCYEFILTNSIDEIYCSISELNDEQMKSLIDFADNNLKVLKFLPDNKEIYTKKMNYDYYGYLPILSLRSIPIDDPINQIIKRVFDIALSIFVLVFILTWLTPILAILIQLESKGPVFFKQKRNGLDYKEFSCYKFRSMKPNPTAHIHQVTRGDTRITKVGKFIMKTSIDELPQFINVLFGDMSVVGPRPHMVSHTEMYAERIDKFMVRHFVKPGITGLAQVSGFRGEVETDDDIINRVKYDIFYVENWSLLLDIKILLLTIKNTAKGEDKAY